MMHCRNSNPRSLPQRLAALRRFLPAMALVAVIPFSSARANVADSIRALLCKGDEAQAGVAANKAHAADPAHPQITLLWARTFANSDTALSTFKRIARDKAVPDSVRSQAYFLLGCAAYVRGLAHKSSGYFSNAYDLSGDSMYAEQRYLSAVNDTADTAVVSRLSRASRDTASTSGAVASYYLGVYYFSKKDYSSALSRFTAASEGSDSGWWACPASAGAYWCAAELSHPQEASAVLVHIRRAWTEYLEQGSLSKVKRKLAGAGKDHPAARDTAAWLPPDTGTVQAPAKSKSEPQTQKPHFSLQVGAFSTMQNAHSLVGKLSPQFPLVSVAEGAAGGKPVYRVHIGKFETKENAQTYGDSTLAKKGISFRVVEE